MRSRAAVASGLLASSGAATLAQAVRILAIFATHLVLRRWVDRADWGLWNWAEPLFVIFAALRDLGLPSHVVRRRPLPLGNLLAVQAIWGGALAAGVALASPWIARGFSTPRPDVAPVLSALAIYLFLEGLATIPMTAFEADLAIRRSLGPELARTAVYCAGTLALARAGWGVWSFVGAQLAAQLVFTVLLWLRARGHVELHFAQGETAELVVRGLPLGGIWLLGYAVTWADSLILGARFPDVAVAGYVFAYSTAFLTMRSLHPPFQRSLYPAFVALADRPREQFEAYRLGTLFLLALEVPAALFLATNAPLVARILGGAAWVDQAPLLALLAFAPLVDPIGRFGGELLIARNQDRIRIVSLALNLAALVGGGIWLSSRYGPVGMAWANFAPVGSILLAIVLARADRESFRTLLGDLLRIYLVPVLPFAASVLLPAGSVARFVAGLAATALGLLFAWRRFGASYRAFFAAYPVEPVPVAPT